MVDSYGSSWCSVCRFSHYGIFRNRICSVDESCNGGSYAFCCNWHIVCIRASGALYQHDKEYLAQFVFNGVVASANGSTVNWCLCGACALGIFSAKINAYICIACSWWDTVLPVILIVAGVS